MRPLVLVALSLSIVSVAPTARADTNSDADALITKGVELREKGHDDEALVLFKQALAKTPSARARAQVALAEQALGMWVLAEVDLSAALAAEGDAWIAKNRAPLEAALAVVQKHVASLEVRGADDAEVYLDGVRLGVGVGPFRVEAGRRTLEVRAAGFHSTTRMLDIQPGGIARETVTLVAMSGPNLDGSHTETSPSVRQDTRAMSDDPGRGQRILGWTFVGTGAALLATGATGLLVRKGVVDDYNASCPGLGVAQPRSCDDQVSSARTWLTVSITAFVASSLFSVGGIVLVAAAPSRTESKPRASSSGKAARLVCMPTTGVTCVGTF